MAAPWSSHEFNMTPFRRLPLIYINLTGGVAIFVGPLVLLVAPVATSRDASRALSKLTATSSNARNIAAV